MQQPETLKGYSLVSAMRMAIAYSHKTEDEIAAGMDWGAASASRFFSSGDYWPALPNIPRLCRVLGNTIILQWLMDNTETGVQPVKPLDAPAMLQSLGGLFGRMGAIAREGQDVLADNEIDAAEALKGVGRLEMLKRRELLTPPEVEELYGLKEGTLKVWRCRGGGPAYHQSTKNAPVLYSHDDIQAFLSKSRVRAS